MPRKQKKDKQDRRVKEKEQNMEGETPNPILAIDPFIGKEEQNRKHEQKEMGGSSLTYISWRQISMVSLFF